MKYLKLTSLLSSLVLLSACNQNGNETTSKGIEEVQQGNVTALLEDLRNRTIELYKWNDTKSTHVDFEPLLLKETDSIYAGLDLARHEQRVAELRETNLLQIILSKITIR